MKKGKIILSFAALVVTVGSALAFKAANNFNGGKRLLLPTAANCHCVLATVWTKAGDHDQVTKGYTAKIIVGECSICTHAFTGQVTNIN